jgi:PAS domain S-box-containing protein
MEEGDAHPNERTSLRETEEALRASEEHLRLALDASHAGTWSWEVISNITTWDNRYHALYGLGPNDPRSYEVWMTRVHPADRPRLESRLKELLEPGAGEIWNEEFRAILPSGGERWMVELGSIERDKDGRAVRFRGINLDITERKRVEQELKVTVSRLRSILDSTADGLLIVDATGRITDFNRQFAGMWQLPEGILAARNDAAALGFVLDQLVAPENFLAKVRELYAHPEQSSSDVLYFKDGRTLERYSQPHWARWESDRAGLEFSRCHGAPARGENAGRTQRHARTTGSRAHRFAAGSRAPRARDFEYRDRRHYHARCARGDHGRESRDLADLRLCAG